MSQEHADKIRWFAEHPSKSCPRCVRKNDKTETVATSIAETDELFGWRRVPAGKKSPRDSKHIPQSHCRTCRSEQSREQRRKARKAAEKEARKAEAVEAG